MSSSLTQSIGVGAATTISSRPSDPVTKDEQRGIEPKHVANQTQISAQASSFSTALKDRSKVPPQVPKRVEAPYNPKGRKQNPANSAKEEDQEESPSESKLDLVA